jgi:hypothetical protein
VSYAAKAWTNQSIDMFVASYLSRNNHAKAKDTVVTRDKFKHLFADGPLGPPAVVAAQEVIETLAKILKCQGHRVGCRK